jgi:hypothetical protein
MTRTQIIAEIKNKLKVYDQQGLLDDISINNWIKENIKEFGGNIMNEYQTALIVEKGRAKLPDNFWALKAAVKCEQEGYVEADSKPEVQNRISYLEWTEISDYYNYLDGKPCKDSDDTKYITETLYFDVPKKAYTFYYAQPKLLNLKPHVYKVRCEANCPNLTSNSEYDISIDENHNYISTNFNSGFIWIWYKGLPCDEKGELMIPETSRDKLKNYIVYFAIVRTLQDLMLSEDDVNIFNKLQIFQPLMDEYYYAAKSESISKGAVGWSTRLINNNRRNTNKYETMFRNL